ncbi:molybdenum cofactor sulfurase [Staphylotrichum tortipilum]|uniref:Molybdenum cofactor sulfurase n=1 Tax=Staphylotrichum tortipilum TaxID=2831512 RepID=A0AAN6MSK4_9PEZI|nr:molybdenum cofactor sulfurase [Staphylotrichum longicolle]
MEDGSTAPRGGPVIDASSAFMLLVTILAFFLPLLLYFPPVPPSRRDALLDTHTQVGLAASESGLLPGGGGGGKGKGKGTGGRGATTATIRSLWIYPLKSCKGIEVRQSKVLPSGLEFDRLYTLAQLQSPFPVGVQATSPGGNDNDNNKDKAVHAWHFITQRQFPRLATVRVDLFVPDIVKARGQPDKVPDPFLLVSFPWRDPGLAGALAWLGAKLARGWTALPEKEFVLPVAFPSEHEIADRGYARDDVTIWRDTITALNMESELPRELSLYLGVSNRLGLFRIDPARLRNVYRCAPAKEDTGYQPVAGFQDAYPLHLLNLSSVRDLDSKIDKDEELRFLDPRRFRANLIIDGGETPYEEETWKKIRLVPGSDSKRDASTFHVSCRTVRCKLPNVDQGTGHRHQVEPDRSLRKHREVDEGAKHMGCLGMQLTPLFPKTHSPEDLESWVEVGMSVEVLERGHHVYKKI